VELLLHLFSRLLACARIRALKRIHSVIHFLAASLQIPFYDYVRDTRARDTTLPEGFQITKVPFYLIRGMKMYLCIQRGVRDTEAAVQKTRIRVSTSRIVSCNARFGLPCFPSINRPFIREHARGVSNLDKKNARLQSIDRIVSIYRTYSVIKTGSHFLCPLQSIVECETRQISPRMYGNVEPW